MLREVCWRRDYTYLQASEAYVPFQSQPSIDSVHTSYTSLCSSPFDCNADAFEHCNFSETQASAQASPLAVDNVSSANCFMGYGASESQFSVANVDGESHLCSG